jgi:hypothetical protein
MSTRFSAVRQYRCYSKAAAAAPSDKELGQTNIASTVGWSGCPLAFGKGN